MDNMFEFVFSRLEPLIDESEEKRWDTDNSIIVIASDKDRTGVVVAGGQEKISAMLADAISRDPRVSKAVRRALAMVDRERRRKEEKQPKNKNPFLGDVIKKPLN